MDRAFERFIELWCVVKGCFSLPVGYEGNSNIFTRKQELLFLTELLLKFPFEVVNFELSFVNELILLCFCFEQLLFFCAQLFFILCLKQVDLVSSLLKGIFQRSNFSLQPLAIASKLFLLCLSPLISRLCVLLTSFELNAAVFPVLEYSFNFHLDAALFILDLLPNLLKLFHRALVLALELFLFAIVLIQLLLIVHLVILLSRH